ncbi:hypothetical protein ACHAXT_006384 [Thalassiosira profunda]
MRSRGIVIAAGLFLSPLAAAAFRSPSSVADSGSSAFLSPERCRRDCNRQLSRLHSMLSDPLDSLETEGPQMLTGNIHDANDIISRAVENSQANGSNGIEIATEYNGHEFNGQPHQERQNQHEQRQRQRHIRKSRKNNKAMTNPKFLRKRTEALLNASGSPGTLKVDKKTFDWLLDAWAYSGESDAVDNALALLSRMEELRETNASVAPTVKSYTKAINSIARSGRRDAGERAEEILTRMIDDGELRPNTFTYTYVIDAYARSPSSKAPHAAQRLVDQMEFLRAHGDPDVKPTTRAWNSVISAWAQWKGEEMAWGHVGSGADRAEACLGMMEELADTTGNEDVRPNSYNYNSVISALAHSQEEGAASRAEKILERMENLYRETGDDNIRPRTATYNAIIDAWAKSGDIDAPDRAELLLAHMMELYETGHNLDAQPNVRSFNSVLNAWAKSGHPMAPYQAGDVIQRMEELDSNSELDVSPDATSFATAINAYARSQSFGKAQRAYELFVHMKELYDTSGKTSLRPNNVVYNSVLNACAFSIGDLEEQSEAIEIANAMLKGLHRSPHGRPDQVTYGTYLKVINNQMPEGHARDHLVETVFRKCAKEGMVGEMVLRQLREMGMEETYESLVGSSMWGEVDLRDLPKSVGGADTTVENFGSYCFLSIS